MRCTHIMQQFHSFIVKLWVLPSSEKGPSLDHQPSIPYVGRKSSALHVSDVIVIHLPHADSYKCAHLHMNQHPRYLCTNIVIIKSQVGIAYPPIKFHIIHGPFIDDGRDGFGKDSRTRPGPQYPNHSSSRGGYSGILEVKPPMPL